MKRNFEASLEYRDTYISEKKLCIDFDIKTVNFSSDEVSKEEIEKEILRKMNQYDKKYMCLKKINKKSATFFFDIDKWFPKNASLKDTANRYEKKLILERLPFMVLNNTSAMEYTKVVEESFRSYIEKNKELKTKISNSVAEGLPLTYYKFKYDSSRNIMDIIVKEQFRNKMLVILRSRNNPRKPLKKMDFDSSVETYLKFTKKKK